MTAKPPTIDAPIEVAKFWRTRWRTESVHVELCFFEGRYLINCRVFRTGADGIDRPTTKGLTLSVAELPEWTRALVKAEAEARRRGLIPNDDESEGEQ